MPHPVFSHVMGTIALIGVIIQVAYYTTVVSWIAFRETQTARLSEIAESISREIVEIVSVHTLGEGNFTYMDLTIPRKVGGRPYEVLISKVEENQVEVAVSLQHNSILKVITIPNFGGGSIEITSSVPCGTPPAAGVTFDVRLRMPLAKGRSPIVVVWRCGGRYYLGLGSRGEG